MLIRGLIMPPGRITGLTRLLGCNFLQIPSHNCIFALAFQTITFLPDLCFIISNTIYLFLSIIQFIQTIPSWLQHPNQIYSVGHQNKKVRKEINSADSQCKNAVLGRFLQKAATKEPDKHSSSARRHTRALYKSSSIV